MLRFMKKLSRKKGLPPGTLVHVGDAKEQPVKIKLIQYDQGTFETGTITDLDKLPSKDQSKKVTWLNIDGVHQTEIIQKIGKIYNIHSLVLEDIVNTGQRPKVDDYGDYLYIVMKMLYPDTQNNTIQTEQVSLLITDNTVISFQEQEGDVFDAIRTRLQEGLGKIRNRKADYLAYALMDAVVDNYFTILETISENLEGLEDEVLDDPVPQTLQKIHTLKTDLIYLRKSVWPLREVVRSLEQRESPIITESTQLYFRDVYDHTIQVMDALESSRDILSGMLDIYLSSTSNRMNEVMKVLTIIATIFIPLTFIAGIYGMNFQYMPELGWKWGYFGVLGIMALVGVIMVIFFRKKKWL
ncbi:MAG: magnesium/cobalt transporter CorA [Fidelibacterota bacterium]